MINEFRYGLQKVKPVLLSELRIFFLNLRLTHGPMSNDEHKDLDLISPDNSWSSHKTNSVLNTEP